MHHPSVNSKSAERSVRPPLRVGIVLAHHFTLSAFAVFVDHLRLAADEGDRSRPLHVQWSIMSRRNHSRKLWGFVRPTSALLPTLHPRLSVVIGGILHADP
jgi:transcriptional regulator GlxA family with amidase domain